MACYGTTSEQFGAVAVAQRAWAAGNPRAQLRDPLTIGEHQASRWIIEPVLRLLDCCQESDGGVALVVTSIERAHDLRQLPAVITAAASMVKAFLLAFIFRTPRLGCMRLRAHAGCRKTPACASPRTASAASGLSTPA